jgi:hypothetical protein
VRLGYSERSPLAKAAAGLPAVVGSTPFPLRILNLVSLMEEICVVTVGERNIKVEGGLLRIGRIDGEKYKFVSDPGPLLEGIPHSGVRIDLFTFLQKLPASSPKYSYSMEWDNVAALPVSTFDHWWTQQIDNKTRNMVRRAEKKGIAVREVPFSETLAMGIHEIYNECPVRQGRAFPHYGKDKDTVHREAATFLDSSVFIGAYQEEQLVGFIKLTLDETGNQAGLMHIVSMVKHRDKAPTNALLAHAVRVCADRRVAFLTYSNYAYGNKQHDSLSAFKENNGFKRVDVPRYWVPLTPLGSVALRTGLHHKLIDYLPESIIAKLRSYRSAWYDHKFRTATQG